MLRAGIFALRLPTKTPTQPTGQRAKAEGQDVYRYHAGSGGRGVDKGYKHTQAEADHG